MQQQDVAELLRASTSDAGTVAQYLVSIDREEVRHVLNALYPLALLLLRGICCDNGIGLMRVTLTVAMCVAQWSARRLRRVRGEEEERSPAAATWGLARARAAAAAL